MSRKDQMMVAEGISRKNILPRFGTNNTPNLKLEQDMRKFMYDRKPMPETKLTEDAPSGSGGSTLADANANNVTGDGAVGSDAAEAAGSSGVTEPVVRAVGEEAMNLAARAGSKEESLVADFVRGLLEGYNDPAEVGKGPQYTSPTEKAVNRQARKVSKGDDFKGRYSRYRDYHNVHAPEAAVDQHGHIIVPPSGKGVPAPDDSEYLHLDVIKREGPRKSGKTFNLGDKDVDVPSTGIKTGTMKIFGGDDTVSYEYEDPEVPAIGKSQRMPGHGPDDYGMHESVVTSFLNDLTEGGIKAFDNAMSMNSRMNDNERYVSTKPIVRAQRKGLISVLKSGEIHPTAKGDYKFDSSAKRAWNRPPEIDPNDDDY